MDLGSSCLVETDVGHCPDLTWVVESIVEAVEGDEEDVWVFFEDFIGRVPMMNIPIENQNFPNPMGPHGILHRDRHIVEDAEAFDLLTDT